MKRNIKMFENFKEDYLNDSQVDEITINLRGLSEENREKLKNILWEQLELIDDEVNQLAIDTLINFKED